MALDRLTKIDGGGISTTSNYRVGIITASKFIGPFDGTGGNFSGVVTATNGVFSGNISAVDGNFSGNVTIGGTLTYEDVTNIDSVGLITARNGLIVTGVTTTSDLTVEKSGNLNVNIKSTGGWGALEVGGSVAGYIDIKKPFSDDYDMRLMCDGNNNYITSNAAPLKLSAQGAYGIELGAYGAPSLKYNNDTKLVITSAGVSIPKDLDVDGHTNLDNVSIAGVTTFTGNIGGTATFNDIDVDGHTNLDNVNIAGVTTSTGNIYANNYYANSFLTVNNNANVSVNLTSTSTTGSSRIFFGDPDSDLVGRISYAHDGDYMQFYTNYGERLRINSDRVIIGQSLSNNQPTYNSSTTFVTTHTNNPGAWNAIAIVSGNSTGASFVKFGDKDDEDVSQIGHYNDDNSLRFYTNGSNERIRITSAGDVGIGYDSPTVKLHVREAASGASSYDNRYHIIVEDDSEAYLGFYVPDNGYAGIRFTDASGQAGYIDYYFSDDEMHYAATSKHIFKVANRERLRIDPAGNLILSDHIVQGNSLVHYIQANDVNGNAQYILGQVSNGNQDLYLQQTKNANLRFQTSGSTRWKIDGNPGHLLPEVAGAVDIGSASAEIGNVYLADNKHIYFGNEQDLDIRFDSSNAAITLDTGTLSIINYANNEDVKILSDNGSGGVVDYIVADGSTGEVLLNHYGSQKLATSTTGITVGGEVAASQDYPSLKPTLDLNFAGTAILDSRVTFTRLGASASYVGRDGYVKFAAQNEPRFDHDPVTRECKGLLIEEQRQNKIGYSNGWNDGVTTDETKSPDGKFNAIKVTGSESGTSYNEGTSTTGVWSVFLKAGSTNYVQLQGGGVGMNNSTIGPYTNNTVINLSDGTFTVNQQNFTAEQYRDGWWRVSVVYTTGGTYQGTTWSIYCLDSSSPSADTIDNAEHCYVWGEVYEVGSFITSYIGTESNIQSIRGADECYIDGQDFLDFYNQTEGTMISSHSIFPNIPSTHNLYTYQISPTGATQHAPLRLLDKNGSYGNSLTAASVYNNSSVFLVQDTGNPVTVPGKKMLTAVSIKKDDYDAVFNGGDVAGDSSGDLFTADHISIGYYKPSPQAYLNGHIQRLTYYPFKLTNNQLKTVTS